MNNFPFYNHFVIKLTNLKQVIDENFVDQLSEFLVKQLALQVVKTEKHIFPNGGLTKVFILSSSHLIVHTWPENSAIHLDLMTCKEGITKETIEKITRLWDGMSATISEIAH